MSSDLFNTYFCSLKSKPEEVEKAVEVALEEGYRLFDTAFNYNNEEAIGRALKRWVDAGKCHREELFITTKVKQSISYKNVRHSANIIKLYKIIIKFCHGLLIVR
jgi:Aldo/keto reductases, related to diketogulonate reductase